MPTVINFSGIGLRLIVYGALWHGSEHCCQPLTNRPRFYTRPVHDRNVVKKLGFGHGFLWLLQCHTVTIIPSMLLIHSCIHSFIHSSNHPSIHPSPMLCNLSNWQQC